MSPRPTSIPTSALGSAARVGGAAALLTGVFAAFDTYSTRSVNADRLSEVQAAYTEAKERYDIISEDPERAEELPQAAKNLQQTSDNLKSVQKEVVKHNNESLFGGAGAIAGAAAGAAAGSVIPGAGTVVGGIVGMVLGMLGAYAGSEIGKDIGGKVEFDVIDKILGRDKKQPDWQTDEGKMFSELSYSEKAEKLSHMSSAESERMTAAVKAEHVEKFHAPSAEAVARHRADAPEAVRQSPENLENKLAAGGTLSPAEMDALNHQRGLAASAQAGADWTQWWRDFFTSNAIKEVDNAPTNLGVKSEMPQSIQEANKIGLDFWAGVKDFFKTAATKEVDNEPTNLGVKSEMPQSIQEANKIGLDFWAGVKDFFTSQSEQTESVQNLSAPDISKLWADFNISDFLPELNISQWLTDSMSGIDLSTLLPDFSSIGAMIVSIHAPFNRRDSQQG